MISLKQTSVILVCLAFAAGVAAATLWLESSNAWRQHLLIAQHRGEVLHDHLVLNGRVPEGMQVTPLSAADTALARAGNFERLSENPRPALITQLNVGGGAFNAGPGARLQMTVISPTLRYPLSELDLSDGDSSQKAMGALTSLMARYCSDAKLVVFADTSGWQRVTGPDLWGCDALPRDRRLLAVGFGILAFIVAFTTATGLSQHFTDFAHTLRDRQKNGRTKPLQQRGPTELRAIIDAVNRYREIERKHLAERAVILSGVTHDLGTPATRLRLRAATIEDAHLRSRFEEDIDQMTGIIESVLTYTRAELSTEETRQVSLLSLVQAVVADFEDFGNPVRFEPAQNVIIESGASIFLSRSAQSELGSDSPLIVSARPLALRRAITNLIDNALKYGRKATVRLEADADFVHILIEDEGGALSTSQLEALVLPFKRGENARSAEGFGMGLTIVSSIAQEHGGDLSFFPGQGGTVAQLRISRF